MVTPFLTNHAEKHVFSKNMNSIMIEILILMAILMFNSSGYSINQNTALCFTILLL